MIAGIGNDIVSLERIRRSIGRFGAGFLQRVLSDRELALMETSGDAVAFVSGRWAAKEAVAKMLGCGIGAKCALTEVEILRDPATGAPRAELSGAAAETLRTGGGGRVWISISHERAYATATAVWETKK